MVMMSRVFGVCNPLAVEDVKKIMTLPFVRPQKTLTFAANNDKLFFPILFEQLW